MDDVALDHLAVPIVVAVEDDMRIGRVGVVHGQIVVAGSGAVEVAGGHGQQPERTFLLNVLHHERIGEAGKAVMDAEYRFGVSVREARHLDVLAAFPLPCVPRLLGSRVDGIGDDDLAAVEVEGAHASLAWY